MNYDGVHDQSSPLFQPPLSRTHQLLTRLQHPTAKYPARKPTNFRKLDNGHHAVHGIPAKNRAEDLEQ